MRERIEVFAPSQPSELRALVVEPARMQKDTPVLLYLHGRREASETENGIQKVCAHGSPPDQARRGRLQNVIVVAPQALVNPEKYPQWDWANYLFEITDFLGKSFNEHRILETGFSQGGLGVLQLLSGFKEGVYRWAIIDPVPHPRGAEHTGLNAQQCAAGWMRYTNRFAQIKKFGDFFRHKLGDAPDCQVLSHIPPDMRHGALARAAYDYGYNDTDKALGGKCAVYDWLEVNFR